MIIYLIVRLSEWWALYCYEGGFRAETMRTAFFDNKYDAPLQIVVVATIHLPGVSACVERV